MTPSAPARGTHDDVDPDQRFSHVRMHREDGILQLTMHTGGSDLVWGLEPHRQLTACLQEVGRDPDTRVVILTGSGETFIHHMDLGGGTMDPSTWERVQATGARLVLNHLDIEVPTIAAINGPASVHAELGLLCDIVLASEHATFRDGPHLPNGVTAGDGAHVVWPLLLGHNRGRYFLLTGQTLSAHQALDMGVVNEVLPADRLLDRAWTLARELAAKPPLAVRYTRLAMVEELRRIIGGQLRYGLALEGLAAIDHWPERFEA